MSNLWDDIEEENNNPTIEDTKKNNIFNKVVDMFRQKPELLEEVQNSYLSDPIKGMMLIADIIKQNNMHKTALELNFDKFDTFLKYDFIDFTNQISIPNEAQLYRKLMDIHDELLEDIKFSELVNKTHIGVGGSFSAGKSSFLNSILGRDIDAEDILPIDSVPTTSIPTYIVKQKEKSSDSESINIYTFNKDGNKSKIDKEALLAISHEFNNIYGFGLTSIINKIVVEVETMPYGNIAFLDTPGYSKADGNQDTDKNLAKKHLMGINSLIWLIDADNGVIRNGDIEFIQSLDFSGDILFVLNKADKKPIADIKDILDAVKETLKNSNIEYIDVVAYSSHEREEYLSDNKILSFLENKNMLNIIDLNPKVQNILNEYQEYLKNLKTKNAMLLQLFNELDLYGGDISDNLTDFTQTLENIKKDSTKIKNDLKLYDKTQSSMLAILEEINILFNQQIEANDFYQDGRIYFNQDAFLKAIESFEMAVKLDKKALYHFDIGACYFNLEQYKKSIKSYDEAIILDNTEPHFFYQRGISYYNIDKIDKAIVDVEKALELESQNQDYKDILQQLKEL